MSAQVPYKKKMKIRFSHLLLWVGVALLLALALLTLLLWARPAITVINSGQQAIVETSVQLPSSRVVFDRIDPGSQASIYYSPNQTDGVYRYRLRLADDTIIESSCGYVTGNQWGQELRLSLLQDGSVRCEVLL